MKLLLLRFSDNSIKLKKSFFSRSKHRDHKLGDYFNRASRGLTVYAKALFDFFFAPAIATTSLLAGDLFLLFANVLLALGYLIDFFQQVFNREVSLFEGTAVFMFLASSITIVMCCTNPVSLLLAISYIAATVNYVFLIKNVIIPPLKPLVEAIFLFFNKDIRGNIDHVPLLDPEKDEYVIRRLLGNKPLTEDNKPLLDSYNKALKSLCWYLNKYNERIFGSILYKERIESIKEDIHKLTEGSASSPIAFFDKKMSFKLTKWTKLSDSLKRLTEAEAADNIDEYNQLGAKFFDRWSVVSKDDIKNSFLCISEILKKEISRQDKKIRAFEACGCIRPPSP